MRLIEVYASILQEVMFLRTVFSGIPGLQECILKSKLRILMFYGIQNIIDLYS